MRRIRAPKDGAPVVLVAGVSATPMVSAAIALQWDLPSVVAVQHAIDPAREVLVRTVSDITGLIERVEIDVEHACTSCAIREDIVPTLERLAASGTWETIVAQLPVTAEPMQVCRVVEGMPGAAPHVRIAGVVVALDAGTLVEDLVGDDLVAERLQPGRDLILQCRSGVVVGESNAHVWTLPSRLGSWCGYRSITTNESDDWTRQRSLLTRQRAGVGVRSSARPEVPIH